MVGPEAAQVLSQTKAAISALNNIKEDYSDFGEAKNLPSAFEKVAEHLQIVCNALAIVQIQIRNGKDDSICAEMKPNAEGCKDKATRLEGLFVAVVPSAAAQRMERYREAVSGTGKGDRVETIMKNMMEDVKLLLTVDDEMKAATEAQLGKLVEAMKEVSAIPPSLPDEGSASSINNFGSGTVNANTGSGTQYNNTGSGQQFTGSVQNVNNAAGYDSKNASA